MNILHITPHLGGGVGEVLCNYIKYEKKNSHTVLSLDKINIFKKKKLILDKIKFKSNIFKKKNQIFEAIKKNDIVLVHWWNHPYLSDLIINFKWPKSRVIIWSHISGNLDPNNFTKKIFSFPDKFIFTTPLSLKNKIFSNLKNKKKFLNIVSTSKINFTKNIKRNSIIRIGYVGSFDFAKCHRDIVDLLNISTKKKIEITLIGNSSNSAIEKQIKNLKTFNKIKIIKNLKNKDVIKKTKKFDIFAYPLNKNHFGSNDLSLQQAIKLKIPQIVFDNPMEKWMVKEFNGALIVKSKNEFKKKLRLLIENKFLQKKLVNNLKKCKSKIFEFDEMKEKLNSLFQLVIKIKKTEKNYDLKKYNSKLDLYIETLNEKKNY